MRPRAGFAMVRWLLAAALLVAAPVAPEAGGAATAPGARSSSTLDGLSRSERAWVRRTLAGLSLEEKAAQLLMVKAFGLPLHPDSAEYRALLDEVRTRKVGGVLLSRSDLDSIPLVLAELQAASEVPLLVASDLERSLSFRVGEGTAPLPDAMAIGASRSEAAARTAGRITAREARAVGVHWVFAPVADVNSNPENPVIGVRSFGEDPQLVARMVAAFVEGVRAEGGVMTAAKHFPGHGDTTIDSHLGLAVVGGDRARLERVELQPFRAAIAAGVDSIMTGHLEVPALDPSRLPATLSRPITTGLLREEMGFRGLVVTDGLDMGSVAPVPLGAVAVDAVAAGADVLLLPPDSRVAVQALVRAVRTGQLSAERLDASVERVLAAKARLGLGAPAPRGSRRVAAGDWRAARMDVGRPQDVASAQEIAAGGVTVLRNDGGVLPLRAERPLAVLQLLLSDGDAASGAGIGAILESDLAARRIPVATRRLAPNLAPSAIDEIVAAAQDATHVVLSPPVRLAAAGALDPTHAAVIDRLAASRVPAVVIAYGTPYALARFTGAGLPALPAMLCTFSAASSSQHAAVAALLGESAIGGKLPVTIPGLYPYGHGLALPRRAMTLAAASAESAAAGRFAEVDRLLDGYLERRAFPGGVVAVGWRGRLAHLRAFGKQSYAVDAPAVAVDTVYDLASLTKVVATTTLAMILVDAGRLDLERPVAAYLPGFRGTGKENVTVRHLLTHSSGLPAGAPLYRELRGKAAIVERIQSLELEYPPGSKSLYSDFGMILLGEIVESAAGQPLDELVRKRVLEPLGMGDTGFLPRRDLLARIAPTELDPWRGRLVHGEVHDENAFAMGGVAPHAGLFGTARDLARFAQMLLYGGVFEHRRIVSRATVTSFTRPAGIADSSRALGWDMKSATGYSSAGTLMSPGAFGHTGYTGTSLWIDPERELFVILLTNRVHPTRDNNLIREVRPALADAVVRVVDSVAEFGDR